MVIHRGCFSISRDGPRNRAHRPSDFDVSLKAATIHHRQFDVLDRPAATGNDTNPMGRQLEQAPRRAHLPERPADIVERSPTQLGTALRRTDSAPKHGFDGQIYYGPPPGKPQRRCTIELAAVRKKTSGGVRSVGSIEFTPRKEDAARGRGITC